MHEFHFPPVGCLSPTVWPSSWHARPSRVAVLTYDASQLTPVDPLDTRLTNRRPNRLRDTDRLWPSRVGRTTTWAQSSTRHP